MKAPGSASLGSLGSSWNLKAATLVAVEGGKTQIKARLGRGRGDRRRPGSRRFAVEGGRKKGKRGSVADAELVDADAADHVVEAGRVAADALTIRHV